MEVPGMDETKKTENHLISPVAFVEGGVQDSYDDACSICLEDFSNSDPSTVTSCKHEFHLQCILEWCQRSSQCPMCWQSVSLKDPTSQELLEAVEHERNFRLNPPRSSRIFHHPTLGNFELPQLPVGANDTELEERILQHLAAAAARGRTHHMGRREGRRSRSRAHGRSQFLVFSPHPEEPSNGSATVSQAQTGENEQARIVTAVSPFTPVEATREEHPHQFSQFSSSQADHVPGPSSGSRSFAANRHGQSFNNLSSASRSSSTSQDRAGPSDLHLFSESLKSRFNAVSTRYKESITKGTRGWKERLFSRSTSISDLGSEVRREVSAGIASVSRMMERLETRENNRESDSSGSDNVDGSSVTDASNHGIAETHGSTHLDDSNASASSGVTSGPN